MYNFAHIHDESIKDGERATTEDLDWRLIGWLFPPHFHSLSFKIIMTGKRLSYCVSVTGRSLQSSIFNPSILLQKSPSILHWSIDEISIETKHLRNQVISRKSHLLTHQAFGRDYCISAISSSGGLPVEERAFHFCLFNMRTLKEPIKYAS